MAFERITMRADGKEFEGWESVQITAAMNEAARKFVFQVTEVPSDPKMPASSFFEKWHFPPFTAVEIYATGVLVLKGRVVTYGPGISPTEHVVTLQGEGDSTDVVDSSAYHPTGEFEDKTPEEIAETLVSPTGVAFKVEGKRGLGKETLSIFRIRKGATVYAELMRIMQTRMATLKGNADGSLSAVTGSTGTHQGILAQGVNIISMSAEISGGSTFAEYIDDGNRGDGTLFETDIAPTTTAYDVHVPIKGRRKIINHPIDATKKGLENRAAWEATRARGFAVKGTLLVKGWRDDRGLLWEPSHNVFVNAPALKIDRMMMIEKVEFRQDMQGGSTAQLSIVNGAAYGDDAGEDGGDDEGGSIWDGPDGGAR